jgi:PilZ domain
MQIILSNSSSRVIPVVETEKGTKIRGVKKETSWRDRREFPRHNVSETGIRFQPMSRFRSPKGDLYGDLVNSSERGLCIGVRIPLKREQVLRLFLPFIDKKTTISTLGEVRWVKRKGIGKDEYWVGVQYLL